VRAIADDELGYDTLSAVYKQLNAPFGAFAQDARNISTNAVTEPDPEYKAWDAQLTACQNLRQTRWTYRRSVCVRALALIIGERGRCAARAGRSSRV
jgi:hypothetical protein